jgi:nicotinate-nucleotide adenylyltransferase
LWAVTLGAARYTVSVQKIGIFSGAFDPIHDGHIAFAEEAIDQAGLNKVFFLIEPRPRHKQGVKALEHRVEMVRLAIAHQPRLGLILLDQPRFNVHETWPQLQARFAGTSLAMLMGEDVFARLSHWPHVDELITNVTFVVGVRSGSRTELQEHLHTIERVRHVRLEWRMFQPSQSMHTSTRVRAALRKGIAPKGVDPAVLSYIKAHGLYSRELEA